MIIYADILIITNFIVDYFLLAITGKIIKRRPGVFRSLLAAFLAATSSLTIFLPEQNAVFRFLFRLALSYIICFANFGYESIRKLSLASFVFLAVTTCFAGSMLAIWYLWAPPGMAVNNSVVYFNISPILLIAFSVLGFLIFSVLSSFLSRRSKEAKKCLLELEFCNKKARFDAIIDSGNSLADGFTQRAVIIADGKKALDIFGELNAEKYRDRYRVIPCKTVTGSSLLDGFRCERGAIITESDTYRLEKPIMAISKTPLCDCEAIVNPSDCN